MGPENDPRKIRLFFVVVVGASADECNRPERGKLSSDLCDVATNEVTGFSLSQCGTPSAAVLTT
jgi:hypothetical protein